MQRGGCSLRSHLLHQGALQGMGLGYREDSGCRGLGYGPVWLSLHKRGSILLFEGSFPGSTELRGLYMVL